MVESHQREAGLAMLHPVCPFLWQVWALLSPRQYPGRNLAQRDPYPPLYADTAETFSLFL